MSHFSTFSKNSVESEKSSSTTDLIRNSVGMMNTDLEEIVFNEENSSINEKSIIRQNRLFYSCGNETMAVYAQLCQDKMYYFEDEECMESIGEIDFRSITHITCIDEDTFELHTLIHDKVHVFAMYDTKCHESELWVNDIETICNISRLEANADEDESYDETTNDSMGDVLIPVIVEDNPWYYYICCCFMKKKEVVIYPTNTNINEAGVT